MGVRSTAILLLLLDTGMRRAELEGLEIEDVDLDAVRHTTDRRLADYCPKNGPEISNSLSADYLSAIGDFASALHAEVKAKNNFVLRQPENQWRNSRAVQLAFRSKRQGTSPRCSTRRISNPLAETFNSCLGAKSSLQIETSLVGPVGIEPTTCGLKVRCSTAELKALANSVIKGTTARTHSGVRIRVGGVCLWRRVGGSISPHRGVSRRARRSSIPPVPFAAGRPCQAFQR